MRILHTMLRVGDLEASKKFYTEILGMNVIREKEFPDGRFTLCFVGYGSEEDSTVLELTYNWDTDKYDRGTGYGHIAIEVDDVYETCEKIKEAGWPIARPAGPMKNGTTVIAFVNDPDGYPIELLGPKSYTENK